ncbi:unnamed protein product [Candidula unifasciata]|uniref:Uncharacterized protein n=1 Tax=Candidula unifasciata TaxID=100452 RepID=A0A8S3YT43_9EUPU|nr:unnamed protein product [Candidula unifasciata]
MLFTPAQAYMPNRHRQRSALRTFFPSSSFSPPDPKEPLRRGILFSTVATVLLLIGTILTWLGFNDVFGGKISMTGPLLIALALLMWLLSLRQFMLVRRRNRTRNEPVQMETVNTGGVTAVVDHDDGNGAATIVIEAWDSEEPIHDFIKNNNDLAPPSYMDIAQSCSSNCPSFMSHEDHNEAPPTYEETCGMYNSYTSLNICPHHGSSHLESSPSPQLISHSGYQFFTHEPTGNLSSEMCPESEQAEQFVTTLYPAARTNQCFSHEPAKTTCCEHNAAQPALCNTPGVTSNPASHSLHFLASKPGADPNPASCATSRQPSEWSRRSFSSIPSYTCLLSESGEVSSHVYDTSSIIEEMMPLLAVQGKTREPECEDTIIPTRSHSLTSVNTFRQGVPYITGPQTGTGSPRTSTVPSPLIHGQQVHSGNLLPVTGPQTGTGSPRTSTVPSPLIHGQQVHSGNLLPVTGLQAGTSSSRTGATPSPLLHSQQLISTDLLPGSTYHHNISDISYKKPTAESLLVPGHNQNVTDLLTEQSPQARDPAQLQSLPVQTNSSTSSSPLSWNISSSEEVSEYGHLLPLQEVRLDMHCRQKPGNITTTLQDGSYAPVTFLDSKCAAATFQDSNSASVIVRNQNNTPLHDYNSASAKYLESNSALASFHDSNSAPGTVHDSNSAPGTVHDSNSATRTVHDSNSAPRTVRDSNSAPARSMISNTQDVQETI